MLIEKLSMPVLSPPPQVGLSEAEFSHSRRLLKPVRLSNDENMDNNTSASMSPRKRILLLLKSKQQATSKPSFGSRLNKRLSLSKKQNQENKHHISDRFFKKGIITKKEGDVDHVKSTDLGQDLSRNDTKHILFRYKSAKITCFENSSHNKNSSTQSTPNSFEFLGSFNTSDRVLGHGTIEIYSIHDKELNYLQCGTVIYPILPKMKVLRIGLNQFILPLSNPERYWLISLNTVEEVTLQELVDCLKNICSFRNLYIRLNFDSDVEEKRETATAPEMTNPVVHKSDSISSISTDVACLNLDKIDSRQSSLDLELDELEETINLINFPSRQPKSCSSSILTDFPMSHNVKHKYSNNTNITDASIHHKPSFDTVRSRNSLYQVEPSWMNIDEDDSVLNKSFDQKTLTDAILFQNLSKFKYGQSLAKLSHDEIRGLVVKPNNNDDQDDLQSRSMVQRLFGW